MKNIDDIIQHYTKEDKPDFKQLALARRNEQKNRRMLVDARETKIVNEEIKK